MPAPRCWDGDKCAKPWCSFTHPGDPGYESAPYSKAHKNKMRDGSAFSAHSGPSGDWRDSHERSRDSGRGNSRDYSSKRYASPDPQKGRSNSGWGDVSPAPVSGGWGSPSPAQGGWGSASPTHGGWGESTSGGWGRSASPAGGGGGWGDPEPSSRRSSSQFGSKSPSKLSSSTSHGGRTASPTRLPPSAPAGDRNREREKQQASDRDRAGGREVELSSPRGRSTMPVSSSLASANRSPSRAFENNNTERKPLGDAMDVDLPEYVQSIILQDPSN
ncbi:cingulin [Ceratobasidium sp. AG-Ba]|nr:cingulin [Ceratobasidium sp. AG-Ba]